MRIVRGLVVIAGVLILGGVALEGDSGPMPRSYRDRLEALTEEQYRTNTLFYMVEMALADAAKMEGKVLTLPELCASPYSPLQCSALVNPYTGKPYEWTAGRPGEISLTPEGDDYILRTDTVDSRGNQKIESVRLSQIFSWYVSASFKSVGAASSKAQEMLRRFAIDIDASGRRIADLSPADRTAYYVGKHLRRELSGWLFQIRDPGGRWSKRYAVESPSLASMVRYPLTDPREVRDLILKTKRGERVLPYYPLMFLEVYRNDFTGGVAERVDAPSPGNYRFEVRADDTGCLVVYGSEGRVVFQANLASVHPQPAVRVDAAGKKKYIDCPEFEDWFP